MKNKDRRGFGQILLRLLFLLYAAVMLWLLFGQRIDPDGTGVSGKLGSNLNLIPLKTVKMYLNMLSGTASAYLLRHAFINLLGNVVMFIPLGFFLPYIWKRQRSFVKLFLSVTVLILLVETVQYFTALGSCDVDDLILNLLGAVIGYGVWKLTAKLRR